MKNRLAVCAMLAMAAWAAACYAGEDGGTAWITLFEKSGGKKTARYAETIDYFRRLDAASSLAHYQSFGRSPEGRELPLFIISSDRAFTPEKARATGKPIILIEACIHAGESEGKEALMMLARELLIEKKYPDLLQKFVLLMIPIFNVDGHERFSGFNRINQNGPEEMGFRVTGARLNLNRDFMKADAAEMRCWLRMYHSWLPHFLYDSHTTDGSDFQYALTYNIDDHENFGGAVSRWAHDRFIPAIIRRSQEAGLLIGPYAEPVDEDNLAKGFSGEVWRPMLSNVYATVCNRAGFLIETHALKPYDVRVAATHDFILMGLQEIARDPGALLNATAAEDAAMAKIGAPQQAKKPFPLQFRLIPGQGDSMVYRGYQYDLKKGEISGANYPVYRRQPRDVPSIYLNRVEPTVEVEPPAGYLIPAAWTDVLAVLEAHGVKFYRTVSQTLLEVQGYRFSEVKFRNVPYEGRQTPNFVKSVFEQKRLFPAGTIYVPLADRSSRLILHLLEPDAPDALVRWGLFNTIFEDKEYFEAYVMEPLAEKMAAADTSLASEFQRRLASDSNFAANPRARLRFFYERSPYADAEKNLYPVFRLKAPLAPGQYTLQSGR